MSAARDVSPCQRFDRWVTAYVDDELDAIHALQVEEHLDACEACRERVALLKATRCSLKRLMSARCPGGLRARISKVLVDARRGEQVQEPSVAAAQLGAEPGQQDEDAVPPSQAELSAAIVTNVRQTHAAAAARSSESALFKLRHIMPLAAAATVLLVFGVMRLQEQESVSAAKPDSTSVVSASLDHLLEEMVAQHAHPPPPETTDPDGLSRFDPYLGLRVRKPELGTKQVRYLGARMMPRQHAKHAMLQYMLRDRHRVSLYVFDSKRVPLRANRLKPRHIGARNVYVGKLRGYSVAASERNGVGYVLTSDLPDDESAKLVLTASR